MAKLYDAGFVLGKTSSAWSDGLPPLDGEPVAGR
jgi:hypothetical protein